MKVLITGGDQGLGLAVARSLRAKGHCVDVMPGKFIIEAVKENRAKDYVESFISDSCYDMVVNNYGINHLSHIGETPACDRDIMEVNVMIPYWVINSLVSNGSVSRVVNVSSMTYKVAQRTTSLYCASKAALSQMTKVMARELSPSGWIINCFAPGKILGTEMTKRTDAQVNELRGWTQEEADEYATSLVPMGRFMYISEAANIVIDILDMEDYVNGTTIEAFGGL